MSASEKAPGGINPTEVAAKNPQVDTRQLNAALRAVSELRKQGIAPVGYAITSPYERPARSPKAMPRAGRRFA